MKPDIYSLAKAGLSKEEINEISECEDKERPVSYTHLTLPTIA